MGVLATRVSARPPCKCAQRWTKVGTRGRKDGQAVLRVVHTIWAFVKGWQVGLHVGRCTQFGRLQPTEERTGEDVRRGERRVGESCGDHVEVPTSWATEFAEVVKIWLSVNLGFPKDLVCTL